MLMGMVFARPALAGRYAGFLVLLCLLFTACADSDAKPLAGPTACEWVNAKRVACCLDEFECVTPQDECFAECLVGWGCEEQVNPNGDPGIHACLWNCSPRYTCNDGLEIYAAFRCDGEGDCRDLEDEVNCPVAPASAPSPSTAAAMADVPDGRAPQDADVVDARALREATMASDSMARTDAATFRDAAYGSTAPGASTSFCDATGLLPPVRPTPTTPPRATAASAVLDAAVALAPGAADAAVAMESGAGDAALSHDDAAVAMESGAGDAALSHDDAAMVSPASPDAAAHREEQ